MWIPGWFGVMKRLDATHPRRAVFLRCRMLFPLPPAARWSRFIPRRHRWRWSAAAKYWFRRTGVVFGNAARKPVRQSGIADDPGGIADPACWPRWRHG